MISIPITERERRLMQWLAERKARPFVIECDGPDLHRLVNHGLAAIEPAPQGHAPMFGRVALTDAGWRLIDL